MVHINNAFDLKVYPRDTPQSIIDRLAAQMNTLPQYLYFSPGDKGPLMEMMSKDDITIGDLLQDMRTGSKSSFPAILEKLNDPDNGLVFLLGKKPKLSDVLYSFIAENQELRKVDTDERLKAYLFLLENQLPKSLNSVTLGKLWRNRNIIKGQIDKDINLNKEKVKETQVLVDIKPLSYTVFIQQEISLEFKLDFSNLTLLEIFDSIVLTPNVPYASVDNLYKILRDFTPDPTWASFEDVIYFKVLETMPGVSAKYTSAVLAIEGKVGEEIGTLQTGLIRNRKGTNEKTFWDNIKKIFNPRIPLNILQRNIVKEKGRLYYYLGDQPIDPYVLGDLVLNDPIFSQYLAIDEHEAATKKKRGSTYIHFFGGSEEENVNANITVYQTRDTDDAHRKYKYGIGTFHLNVLISEVKSEEALNNFTFIFGKLLALYYQKAREIIKFYQNLLDPPVFPPKFQRRADPVKGKKEGIPLSRQAPEVFVAGYPTKCTHQPRLVTEEEANAAREQGLAVMVYPKTNNEGFPQRWYICDEQDAYPFPGLRTNDLSNNDIVPFLPCCFKTKQDWGPGGKAGKSTKIYGHYFYDIPLPDRGAEPQQLLVRDVFTGPSEYGELPSGLQELLDLIVYLKGWRFVRSGVFDTRSSFLECILEALQSLPDRKDVQQLLAYGSTETIKADEDVRKAQRKDLLQKAKARLQNAKVKERVQLLSIIRKRLATKPAAAACSQEMYDYSESEILKAIEDPDTYFDPRLFANLVEKSFKCKVILFSRVIPSSDGGVYQGGFNTNMTLPRHTRGYYKTKEEVPTILIYEHVGRGRDQRSYPRCELISYWKNNTQLIVNSHKSSSSISKELGHLYDELRKSYVLNCPIPENSIPLMRLSSLGVELTEQEIDSYGKCRALMFNYQGEKGVLLTTPMQPFLLPRSKNEVSPRLSHDFAKKLLKELGIEPTKISLTNNNVTAYSGTIGNTKFSLPFISSEDLIPQSGDPGEVEGDIIARDQVESRLVSYTRDKRVARYMVEYVRWLYSRYLHDKNIEDSIKSLQAFVENSLETDENARYGPVAKTFNINSGITREGRLYVKSEEAKKRLIYTLRLFAMYHPSDLKEYYRRTSINNYYLNVADFTRYRSQVILQGNDAVVKWIRERDHDFSVHSEVVVGKDSSTPYFFKNPLVEAGDMCLLQPASGLPQSISIAKEWNEGRLNTAREVDSDKIVMDPKGDFTVYSYQSPTKIEAYVCEEGCRSGQEEDGVKILGYKDDDKPVYTSILSLGPCEN